MTTAVEFQGDQTVSGTGQILLTLTNPDGGSQFSVVRANTGGHLTIGRGAIAVGQSGVTNSLDPGAFVAGYPAIDNRDWRKASVLFRRLPELKRRIEQLEARVAELARHEGTREGSS